MHCDRHWTVFTVLVIQAAPRNWHVTGGVIVVPLSVPIAILQLSFLDNSITPGRIAATIGLLIDEVIVMIEHIAHPGEAAVLPAARESFSPPFGSILATIINFLPPAFLSGVLGSPEAHRGELNIGDGGHRDDHWHRH
ncbi:MAG: efflux RND transporter permease subunit [Alphaproteobacteria bacterium]|nr:efflux RND transporter permease subunit [Alphaproteobacteria bacterium]